MLLHFRRWFEDCGPMIGHDYANSDVKGFDTLNSKYKPPGRQKKLFDPTDLFFGRKRKSQLNKHRDSYTQGDIT